MSIRTESPFIARVITSTFAVVKEFDRTIAVSPVEQPTLKLLIMADFFSKLLDILEKLRFLDGHKAVQINPHQVLSLETPSQPQIISLEKFAESSQPYLSFEDIELFGVKPPHLTGLQPILQN